MSSMNPMSQKLHETAYGTMEHHGTLMEHMEHMELESVQLPGVCIHLRLQHRHQGHQHQRGARHGHLAPSLIHQSTA